MLGNIVEPDHAGVIGNKGISHAVALGPACPADAVDVVFVLVGHVVVEHRVHIVHVDASGRHIGGDKDPQLAPAEPGHHFLTLFLGNIAVNALGVHTPHLQQLGDTLRIALGVAEDHGPVVLLQLQNPLKGVHLFVHHHVHAVLEDIRLVLLVGPYGDLHRIPLVDPSDVHDLPADGGGEKAKVFPGLHMIQQAGHLMNKAHVQHPVRLIENDGLGGVDAHGPALHVVPQAAGGGHHDLGLLLQRVDLLADGLTAIEADHADARLELGQIPHLSGDLHGQFPGRGQDHRLDLLGVRVDVLNNGDAEGKGFAGTGGGLGSHILPLQHGGDAPGLDGGGYFIAFFL